jgi:murein endopeptidase
MNGGSWRPHASHQIGVDVDAYFPRYELRNQAAVDKLVSLLGSSLGPKIARIFVTFTPGFSAMLENVPTLPNGVQPKRVIRNVPFHGGHFHIRFASPQ